MRKVSRQSGFTLIELLITLVVIGLLMAIAIPNLLNAINRGKQKRTMADIRSIATALESYSVDNTIYPLASDVSSLAVSIAPTYLDVVPPVDGWNQAFHIDSVALAYTVASEGMAGGGVNVIGGPTSNLTDAIIFTNGGFSQWPDGTQK